MVTMVTHSLSYHLVISHSRGGGAPCGPQHYLTIEIHGVSSAKPSPDPIGVINCSAVSHQALYSSQTLITLVMGRIKTIFLVMSREFLLTHDIRFGWCFPKYTIFLLSYGGQFPQRDLNGNVSSHATQVP